MTSFQTFRLSLVAATLALAGFGFAAPALAHAHLQSETPAANATVAAPQELRLKFSEELEVKFTTVKLTGPNKAVIKTGTPSLAPSDKALLVVPLTDTLPAGKYTVEWHATATDTHKTQGTYSFTVKP